MKPRYNESQLRAAISKSISYAQILKNLGLQAHGGNYVNIKNQIRLLDPPENISHLLGKSHGKSMIAKERHIDEYLVKDGPYIHSSTLKAKLFKLNMIEKKCSNPKCGLTDWLGGPLSLHLDHINGNNRDNRLENLRILCPNCHAQTETYCRGERRKSSDKVSKCSLCSKPVLRRSHLCKTCVNENQKEKRHKILWPSIEELVTELKTSNFLVLSRKLGVSDNTIRKHLKVRGVVIS